MEQRKIALLILNEYEIEKTYLNLALKNGLLKLKEGRNFVTELVYGVVRYRRFLDEKIGRYSTVKLRKLSIPVKNILRIGFYQIYFMDTVPDFAIVDESVKLAEKFAYRSKSFVNAILRKGIERTEEEFPVCVKESFSDEIYQLLQTQYGEQTDTILHRLNEPIPLTLRYNHMRYTNVLQAKDKLLDAEIVGDVLIPQSTENLLSLIKNGDFSVQGLPSQMAVQALSPQSGERILDCCSAPGGKASYIGELMQNQGELVACELHSHRCELVKKNLARCGITIGTVLQGDASAATFPQKFDRILVDAPCSGLGVIGNKPDIKWRDFQFDHLLFVQQNILDNISRFLKKDGILVYATCTINQKENEQQIYRFLKEHSGFSLDPFSVDHNGNTYGQDGMVQILPEGLSAGFFIAKMKKHTE